MVISKTPIRSATVNSPFWKDRLNNNVHFTRNGAERHLAAKSVSTLVQPTKEVTEGVDLREAQIDVPRSV
jgi:hypothetical protein